MQLAVVWSIAVMDNRKDGNSLLQGQYERCTCWSISAIDNRKDETQSIAVMTMGKIDRYLVFCAQSSAKVISGRQTIGKIHLLITIGNYIDNRKDATCCWSISVIDTRKHATCWLLSVIDNMKHATCWLLSVTDNTKDATRCCMVNIGVDNRKYYAFDWPWLYYFLQFMFCLKNCVNEYVLYLTDACFFLISAPK